MDKFQLDSGCDIYSQELELIFNQPKIIEIASFLEEEELLSVIGLLNVDKSSIKFEEKTREEIEKIPIFIIILFLLHQDPSREKNFLILLQLILKQYIIDIDYDNNNIRIKSKQKTEVVIIINTDNFEIFKKYINEIYYIGLKKNKKSRYNTNSEKGAEIARKLEKMHERSSKRKKEESVFANKISVLAEGLGKTMNEIYTTLTIRQFLVQYSRLIKHEEYNQAIKATMIGAKDIEIEDWHGDI